ncbi:unnamed protein product [Cylindrotheca closterium]|uniref:PDZ domain-containing protein n=1 Tax=Cylindrotheca closterium TaxID=2856 RepID=A0AAD2FEL6_9STRA|nr:unnamed protein product [Cylindrotheca closterium]
MGFLRRSKKNECQQHGSVVEAVVRKKSEKVKYGIVFHRSKPNIPTTIESIRSKCLFTRKGLLPGMYVLEVNGQDATWKTPKDCARLLKSAPVGSNVSIKAAIPKTIRVKRDSEENSWGFSIKNSTKREGIFIDNVAPKSIMASSGLEHGMLIIKINGKTFPNEIKDAALALRASGNSIEITLVQLEAQLDFDLDDISTATDIQQEAGDEMEPGKQEEEKATGGDIIEGSGEKNESSSHPRISTAEALEYSGDKVKETSKQKQTTAVLQTVTENRDDVTNAPTSKVEPSTAREPPMVQEFDIDMDDFSFAESESKIPIQKDENSPSGWFFRNSKKEEECFDLDDQFPERYTKNNNPLFQSVLPPSRKQSRTSEVVSQVMQLRKLRKPIPKSSIATVQSPVDDEKLNRRAIIFGLKKEAAVPTVQRFDPKTRRPRFFRGASILSLKSRSSKVTKEERLGEQNGHNSSTSVQSLFDILLSFQDTLCATLVSGPTQDSTAVANDTKSRKRTVIPVRKAKAENPREIEEQVLEL